MNKINLLLDTDIGTDADDAMTLVQLAGASVSLKGITLGYGPTCLRWSIAKHYLDAMSWNIPLHAGKSETLSGKEIWLSGREGRTLDGLDFSYRCSEDAVDFLAQTLRASSEPLTLLCISPLTNIGELLTNFPDVKSKIEQLVIMGGNFVEEAAEHNFASDTVAANRVLESGIRTTVIGLDATKQLKLFKSDMEEIRRAGRVGEMLAREIDDWWDFWDETWSVPHDPIALVALETPGLFEFSEWGSVRVIEEGALEGVSVFTPGDGNVRYVTSYDKSEVGNRIIEQIVKGARKNATD
jgi:inosine-uridine nucleoside N-ribohydrolase